MSGHGESVSSVTPDKQSITPKNKINRTLDILIVTKEYIQESVNPSKRENSIL